MSISPLVSSILWLDSLSAPSSAQLPGPREEGLMKTSHLGLSAPKSLTLHIVQSWVCLFPTCNNNLNPGLEASRISNSDAGVVPPATGFHSSLSNSALKRDPEIGCRAEMSIRCTNRRDSTVVALRGIRPVCTSLYRLPRKVSAGPCTEAVTFQSRQQGRGQRARYVTNSSP